MASTNSLVNLDIAKRLDVTCRKGDSFSLTVDFTDADGSPIDLSLYSFELEVRDASDSVVISKTSVTYTKNSDSTTGRLVISIDSASVTTAGRYVYDLESTRIDNLYVQTWLYGLFAINEDVTQ
jgi:hypothetical protein